MKIAVCFSGQIRTGVVSSKSIKSYLGTLYQYCDFFIHSWDINTYTGYSGSNIFRDNEKVSDDTINDIINIYNPKKIEIENFNEIKDTISSFDTIKYLWYSYYMSVKYKREFEIDNNFKYDIVIKMRFDMIFEPYRVLSFEYKLLYGVINNTIYIENMEQNVTEETIFIDDVYYMGSSDNIDIMSSYYHNFGETEFIVHDFIKYLNYNNISYYNPNVVESFGYYVFGYCMCRPECVKYFKETDYNKRRLCDYYHYSFNDHKNYITGRYVNELKDKYITDELIEDKLYNISDLSLSKERKKTSEILIGILIDKKNRKMTY